MTIRYVILAMAALLAPSAAAAIDQDELMACAAEANSVMRLACYDRIAAENGLVATSKDTTASGTGAWVTNTRTDPLTDRSVHTAMLLAESGRGRFGDPIALLIRCSNNRTEMYIDWSSYLGMDSTRTTYRIGKDPAQTSSWTNSTDHKAAFFPGSPVGLLRRMATGEAFVANVTPYSESPITATFDTRGCRLSRHPQGM